MTSSVDGLVSGLSTSSLIQQLMQAESAPQQRLQGKVTTEQKKIAAFQSVNTKLAALENAADALGKFDTWTAVRTTASSDAVTASAVNGAATGSLTFNVVRLARSQVATAPLPPGNDPITAAASLELTIGGTPVSVALGTDKTAQGVVNAINAKGIDVKAAVVSTSEGPLLQLSSTKTGSAGVVAVVSGLNPGIDFLDATSAQDALIQVGEGDPNAPGNGAYTITSSTNTFTGLMNGVTLTVNRAENNVTVGVASDVDGMASKLEALVNAANGALSEIGAQTAFDVASKAKKPLTGDANMRQMTQNILSAVGNGLSAASFPDLTNLSFKQLGVELDRTGKFTFKKETFLAAQAASPATVQKVATGLADKMEKLADEAQTLITTNTQSRDNMIRNLNTQIDSWGVRLKTREAALQRQFSNLEVSLGKLREQSSWLSGQIGSLG